MTDREAKDREAIQHLSTIAALRQFKEIFETFINSPTTGDAVLRISENNTLLVQAMNLTKVLEYIGEQFAKEGREEDVAHITRLLSITGIQ